MDTKDIYAALAKKFGDAIEPCPAGLAGDPFVVVKPERLHEVMTHLRDDPALTMNQLTLITGVDRGDVIESVYHLYSYKHFHSAVIKVRLNREAPEVDSVADLWGAADWHERECFDMVGIVYRGHPDLKRILLPDDWEGHPLRADYKAPKDYHGIPTEAPAEAAATRESLP
ncbi:MAG: NADH-quinone oxidoreductase subunit C [Candidatus Sumerlaeota bacterium]|nr:NADH-quinone oxidoreductase subunit C [Candidatus Sumerlaeota bacterium]